MAGRGVHALLASLSTLVALLAAVGLVVGRVGVDAVEVTGLPGVPDDGSAARSYAGLYTVNATTGANMFYWFFEPSSSVPSSPAYDAEWASAPVVLWLNGGPGCSSATGLFHEMGPYRIKDDMTLAYNNLTWNEQYFMLFVDQPVGTGYSYLADGDAAYVTDEQEMADELYSLLAQFFTDFARYAGNDFYVFGESYAGKYVPSVSAKILRQNELGAQPYMNLRGLGIGDGLTSPYDQIPAYADFAFSTGIVDEQQREHIRELQGTQRALIASEQFAEAYVYWQYMIGNLSDAYGGGVNYYDLRTYAEYDFSDMDTFLNMNATKDSLGVPRDVAWSQCRSDVGNALDDEHMRSVKPLFPYLLDRVRVLLYNGQYDLIICVPGAEAWIKTIEWHGSAGYMDAVRVPWTVDGLLAGYTRRYDALTQLVVGGAGHLSPMDQPVNTRVMLDRFIADSFPTDAPQREAHDEL